MCCKNSAIIGLWSDKLASLRMQITSAPYLINQNHVTLITSRLMQEELNIINLDFVQCKMSNVNMVKIAIINSHFASIIVIPLVHSLNNVNSWVRCVNLGYIQIHVYIWPVLKIFLLGVSCHKKSHKVGREIFYFI